MVALFLRDRRDSSVSSEVQRSEAARLSDVSQQNQRHGGSTLSRNLNRVLRVDPALVHSAGKLAQVVVAQIRRLQVEVVAPLHIHVDEN